MRALCILLAIPALWGQFRPEPEGPRNPLAGDPQAVAAGAKLFANSCSGCHGPSGEGGRGPNLTEGRRIRRLSDQGLFTSIHKGVPGTDMPPTNLPDDQIWQLVAFVRDLAAPAYEIKLAGDADAGASVFFNKGGCVNCHMIHGRGGFLGPDLTDIGAERTAPQLRQSILKPSARIVEGYEGVTATPLEGAAIKGVARNNDDYSIQILDSKGNLHLLSKDKLRDVVFRKDSLMPADYEKRLTPAEITDVIAFLARQSVRPPGEPRAADRHRGCGR